MIAERTPCKIDGLFPGRGWLLRYLGLAWMERGLIFQITSCLASTNCRTESCALTCSNQTATAECQDFAFEGSRDHNAAIFLCPSVRVSSSDYENNAESASSRSMSISWPAWLGPMHQVWSGAPSVTQISHALLALDLLLPPCVC